MILFPYILLVALIFCLNTMTWYCGLVLLRSVWRLQCYMCVHVCVHVCVCMCVFVCVCMFSHAGLRYLNWTHHLCTTTSDLHTQAHTHAYTNTHTSTHTHAHTHKHLYICVHDTQPLPQTHTHTSTRTHTHTHTHTHLQTHLHTLTGRH